MTRNIYQVPGGPWHYCGRCDDKVKIHEETWQNGVLLCPTCVDNFPQSPGIRERMIVQRLDDGKIEFMPDPKITNPDNNIDKDDNDIQVVGW
jgi:hypothetical protein